MTADGTMPGVILGTTPYMSPEQARGQPVDKRTDIWAFGCVFFEMLTGASPFGRQTVTDTIAAVIGAEPEWTSLPPATPGTVRHLLTRCLQKDARRRLHDIADARVELEDAMAAAARGAAPRRRWTRPGIAALALVAAALVVVWVARDRFWRSTTSLPPDTRVTRLTDLPGLEESPAISPDGRSVAFSGGVNGKRQIFVQLVAGGAPLQITHDPVDHESPRWTPDSSAILYFSAAAPGELEGSIWEIPALGGVPRRVVNSVGGADISPTDGRLALFQLATNGIQLVTANRRVQVQRGRQVRRGHVLRVSPLVAGRPMDCLSAGRQRQVRRVRGAVRRRRTAPVDA